jgi:uncharacterized protein YccT (UPF0319 family)
MGSHTGKKSSRENGSTNKIPSDSPSEQMLRYWFNNLRTKGKKK